MNIYTVKCNNVINGIINKAIHGMNNTKVTPIFDTAHLIDKCEFVFYQWPDDNRKGLEQISEILGMSDWQKVELVIVANLNQSDEVKNVLKDRSTKIIVNPIKVEQVRDLLMAGQMEKWSPAKTQALKADYINPFIESTINVITQVTGVTPEKSEVDLKSGHELIGDVSGVLGLAGTAEGFLIIILSKKLSCELISRMLSVGVDEISDDDVRDGIGELANMVSGNAKAALVGTPYHFELSIPTVVIGSSHSIAHPPDIPCVTVTFKVLDEEFKVAVALIPKEDTK